jgi:hypothetical protein
LALVAVNLDDAIKLKVKVLKFGIGRSLGKDAIVELNGNRGGFA